MKQITFTWILAMLVQGSFSQNQLLNGSFEDTTITNTMGFLDSVPAHWQISQFGAHMIEDAAEGQMAVRIYNWYYYVKGTLTNGNSDRGGTPVNFRPTKLSGKYRYNPGNVQTTNDSAVANILLCKYNPTTLQRDTIGFGERSLGPADMYTLFEVPVIYRNETIPDTVLVNFLSSRNGFCSNDSDGNCLFLDIDQLSISDGTTSSEEVVLTSSSVVYPNPAQDVIQIPLHSKEQTHIRIYATDGKLMQTAFIPAGLSAQINIGQLPKGIYMLFTGDGAAGVRFVKE